MEPTTFAELKLSAKVLAAVDASGYTTPTPIQAGAIPPAIDGKDVLGIAQTGTGKTASFVLPMITRLETGRARARMPRSLILAPTRELAAQVAEAFETYGVNNKFTMALLIGGVSFGEQLKKLDRGVDVLIATPGRLLDHISRGKILLTGVEILVIDEADRMLDMGFIPDIEKICKLLPPRRQTLFFSATMPGEITRLAGQFLKDPVRVEVAPPATTAKTITQRFKFCPDGSDYIKREILRDMIRQENVQNAIVFCNRKRDVAILLKSLLKHGFNAGALHGDMDQSARMATLAAFRSGEITLLAASDVAARGLDIPAVSHVFNYDMPWQSDDYVHRIGRTGRAGRQGFAAALVTADDLKVVRELEKMAGQPVEWIDEPPGEGAEAGARGRGRGRGGKGRGRSGSGGAKAPAAGSSERSSGGRGRRSRNGRSDDAKQPAGDAVVDAVAREPAHEQPEQSATAADAPGRDRPEGETAKPRSRRSRRPSRARKPEGSATDSAAATADHDQPSPPAKKAPRRDDVGKTEAPARKSARPAAKRGGRKPKAAEDNTSGAPKGLGDNVPAFLKRPVRLDS